MKDRFELINNLIVDSENEFDVRSLKQSAILMNDYYNDYRVYKRAFDNIVKKYSKATNQTIDSIYLDFTTTAAYDLIQEDKKKGK